METKREVYHLKGIPKYKYNNVTSHFQGVFKKETVFLMCLGTQ